MPTGLLLTTGDHLVRPRKQRALAEAIHAEVVEVAGDHLSPLTMPVRLRSGYPAARRLGGSSGCARRRWRRRRRRMRPELLADPLDRVAQLLQPVVEVLGGDHVAEGQADAGDLAGEELGVGLRALGDAPVGLGLGAVAQLLAVLGQQDERGGVGGLGGEGQVEQDERVRIPPERDDDDVDEDPDGDDDGLDDEEPSGAEVAGDGLAELAEGLGVVVDAEVAPRLARTRQVLAAPSHDPIPSRRRCRQSAGSVRSSTSSTVMAPSNRRCSSQTATASRL